MDGEKIAIEGWGALERAETGRRPAGRWARRVGLGLSGVAVLFLLFDAVAKLVKIGPVVSSMAELGWSAELARPLGATLLACILLYAIPRTAPLGAVLLTGYLGGAIATHARVGDPLLSHTLFPVYVAALLWVGLLLRDARVRALVPRG